MRKILTKNLVTLSELKIEYDMDNRMETIKLTCLPNKIEGTGREVTEKQLESIFEALYGKRTNQFIIRKINYIKEPIKCVLVFSTNTLVAIGNENQKTYCYLPEGIVVDETELNNMCKDSMLASKSAQIDFHAKMIRKLISEMEKIRIGFEEEI